MVLVKGGLMLGDGCNSAWHPLQWEGGSPPEEGDTPHSTGTVAELGGPKQLTKLFPESSSTG